VTGFWQTLVTYLLLGGSASLFGLLCLGILRNRRRKTAVISPKARPLDAVFSEAFRLIRLQANQHKAGHSESIKVLLSEIQERIGGLPPTLQPRYEKRMMKALEEAARIGITLSPEAWVKR